MGNSLLLKDADDVCQYLLKEARVASVPGSAFGARDHIRLSYACSIETLEAAVERIRLAVEKLKHV